MSVMCCWCRSHSWAAVRMLNSCGRNENLSCVRCLWDRRSLTLWSYVLAIAQKGRQEFWNIYNWSGEHQRLTLCADTGRPITEARLITAGAFWINTCHRDICVIELLHKTHRSNLSSLSDYSKHDNRLSLKTISNKFKNYIFSWSSGLWNINILFEFIVYVSIIWCGRSSL